MLLRFELLSASTHNLYYRYAERHPGQARDRRREADGDDGSAAGIARENADRRLTVNRDCEYPAHQLRWRAAKGWEWSE
jgi:hypothetical protein